MQQNNIQEILPHGVPTLVGDPSPENQLFSQYMALNQPNRRPSMSSMRWRQQRSMPLLSKHEILKQCWVDVGPAS